MPIVSKTITAPVGFTAVVNSDLECHVTGTIGGVPFDQTVSLQNRMPCLAFWDPASRTIQIIRNMSDLPDDTWSFIRYIVSATPG